jgi:hypothetical protein
MRSRKVDAESASTRRMPKIDLPGGHHKFTDRQIRIGKAGEPYTN